MVSEVDQEVLEACEQWLKSGDPEYNQQNPVLGAYSYADCNQYVKESHPSLQQVSSSKSQTSISTTSSVRIPNMFKNEAFMVISLCLVLPLLFVGFYTRWTFKWQSSTKESKK